jgi:release factor glutamine methyltransferase
VDAGTGTGAIALSLAVELGPEVVGQVWATEASAGALAVAAANLASVLAAGPAGSSPPPQVALARGSWLDPLPDSLRGRVDLVVSNPPYVSAQEWEGLDDGVRREPRSALVAGPGSDGTPGLADVEAVLGQAIEWTARPAAVVVELAPHQADAATELARRSGYDDARVEPDLAGRRRALVARVGT